MLIAHRRRAAVTIALLATMAVAGMSYDIPATALGGATVDIHSYRFDPRALMLHVGDTVTWTNHDRAAHDVTFTADDVTSGSLAAGRSWTFTFTQPGTMTYLCQVHPDMTGVVTVLANDEPATTLAVLGPPTPTDAPPAPPPSSAPVAAPPAPETTAVATPPRTHLSVDPRLLIAAALTGLIVFSALLLGRDPAHT